MPLFKSVIILIVLQSSTHFKVKKITENEKFETNSWKKGVFEKRGSLFFLAWVVKLLLLGKSGID